MSCSMQKKIESLQAVKESSYTAGAEFFDQFIKSRAQELVHDYDVNDAQGDGWYEIGNGTEEIERDDRDGFMSYNDGGYEKTWMSTSRDITLTGFADNKIDADYDKLQAICEDDYKHDCEKDGKECNLDSEDFWEYEDSWWEDGSEIFARIEIMLYSRDSYDNKYILICRVRRSFDYTYGRTNSFEDDLSVTMDLTKEQLTESNAIKFLDEAEKQLNSYKFDDGEKNIDVQAD